GAPVFTLHVFRGAYDGTWPPIYLISDDPDVLARARHGVGIRSMVKPAVRALSVAPTERVAPTPLVRPSFPESTSGAAAQGCAGWWRGRCPGARSWSRKPPATGGSCTRTCRSARTTTVT